MTTNEPGWPTDEDYRRAEEIARRLAPFRKYCLYPTDADADDMDFTD